MWALRIFVGVIPAIMLDFSVIVAGGIRWIRGYREISASWPSDGFPVGPRMIV
ncbi:MAG: hypothetical protein H6669_05400 [Ardenticatenaceae bacterium]|nr:hypothetical protein [Ardenticatenaceae bacterium]